MPAGRLGQFTLFGLGGLSKQQLEGKADSALWEEDNMKQYSENFTANTGVLGLTHSLVWGDNTFLKTVVAVSGTNNGMNIDAGVRLKRNYEHLTTTLALDVQNASNRQNIYGRYFDKKEGKVKYWYQAPLIPVLSYKVEF